MQTSLSTRRMALVTVGLTWLAGCSVLPMSGGLEATPGTEARRPPAIVPVTLSPAARPDLQAGDTFFFGRSTVLRLLRQESAGQQHWRRTSEPAAFVSSGDFFVPALRTESPALVTESTLQGQPRSLWPLAPGKSVQFTENRQMTWPVLRLSRTASYAWRCEVVDARMSYVPAGDFETFHVRCEGRSDSVLFPTERLSWDYAPQMGHDVRRTWFAGGRERVATLSAALPGALATDARVAGVLRRLASQP